ncbi:MULTISPECIES: ABC transporter permease [unclassified Pseudarthrobacter]|uniref:ABC transporter permease n=1 Tax=unclassified Pseudarthrobacter TaxID=2647000 RepID=UPI003076C529
MTGTTTRAIAVRAKAGGGSRRHPVLAMLASRIGLGILTLWVVSAVIFLATNVLPGNAALAIAGRDATGERLAEVSHRLGLDRSLPEQYASWIGGVLRGDLGNSLTSGLPVWDTVEPRLVNSAVLVLAAGVISTLLGVWLGAVAARRRGRAGDYALSVGWLSVAALPEFVIGIVLVMLFSTIVVQWFPAVALIPANLWPWEKPQALILPIATLVLANTPYTFRMMRGAMVEALESEYVQMGRLKGLRPRTILWVHALPNALAPIVQAIALSFAFLAGGAVVVEYLFAYPGLGYGFVEAVNQRDLPVIQLIALLLAGFYIVINIVSDVLALLASPRRRIGR